MSEMVEHSVRDRGTTGNCTAFQGYRIIGRGMRLEMVALARSLAKASEGVPPIVLNDADATLVEWNGPLDEGEARGELAGSTALLEEKKAARGRPKLGVTSREVTLLPRHWEWLEKNPAGASARLREIVEKEMRSAKEKDRRREAFEAVERFGNAVAGDLPGAEEISRALYAGNLDEVRQLAARWPEDIRRYYLELAERTLPNA